MLYIPIYLVRAGDWTLDLGDSDFPLTPNEKLDNLKLDKEKKQKGEESDS